MSNSCWLIEFTDGQKMIISEEYYLFEVTRNFAGKDVLVKEHWFDIVTCLKRNRGIPWYGLNN